MNNIIRSAGRFVFGKVLPRWAYPVVVGPLRGARFVLGALSGAGGGATVYFNALEPQQSAAMAKALGSGQVFFDIGANVGYYSILASRLVGTRGTVIAFEPVIRNLSYLYRHIILNSANNVVVLTAACADSVSISTFSAGESYAEGHLAGDDDSAGRGVGATRSIVPTVTVDAVVRQFGVSPDVMKIDVEGAEYLVLKGAYATLLEAKPCIFLSVHSDALRSTCLEHLRSLGYVCQELAPNEFLAKCVKE
jgi:FkbM family methyltransferase